MYYNPPTNPKKTVVHERPNQQKRTPRGTHEWLKELPCVLWCVLAPLYMEIVVRISNLGEETQFTFRFFIYILLACTAFGLFKYILSRFIPKRVLRLVVLCIINVVGVVYYATEMILYHTFFKQYQGLRTLFGNMGDVVGNGFGGDTARSAFAFIFEIILLLIPLAILIGFNKRIVRSSRPAKFLRPILAGVMIISQLVFTIAVYANPDDKEAYATEVYNENKAITHFGLLTGLRLDLDYNILGNKPTEKSFSLSGNTTLSRRDQAEQPQTSASDVGLGGDTPVKEEPVTYTPNALNIDFAGLAANESNSSVKELHEYFASQEPSMKNKYTGIFKGKNCIFITAESFTPYFVSKEATPTLYKMMNNGFVFTNYYQPAWGVSTSDGEYSGLTGLVPEAGINSMKATKHNNLYTSLGNTFTRLGYFTEAYHANSYTYYDRNETHPNFGYSRFIGWGNGIEVGAQGADPGVTKTWPESDLEAMETVIPWFIDHQPFHIYYMSVSGHPLYSFTGNRMASKNKDLVEDLPYSDSVKAYYACNYEFEASMEYLLDQLEEAGILDDTVIVINADHYPYGLDEGFEGNDKDYLSELVGHTVDQNFERHKNQLIIYCSEMKEPVIIDDPCYSLDILPTLSNLFGFDFDSRLYTGRDVLDPGTVPLVLFRNYSWITDKGMYNASKKEFVPYEGVTVDDDYVKTVSEIVKTKVYVAKQILETNYYDKIFD